MATNKRLATVLRRIKKASEFTNCAFSDIEIGPHFKYHFPEPRVTTDQVTDGIREATRLYRETWIIPIIDDLIEYAEGNANLRDIERAWRS